MLGIFSCAYLPPYVLFGEECVQLGGTDIFLTLSLPIHEHSISLPLFRFFDSPVFSPLFGLQILYMFLLNIYLSIICSLEILKMIFSYRFWFLVYIASIYN